MNLTDEQLEVVNAEDAVLVVLGGAGTGKTTTAAAMVRRKLEVAHAAGRPERALFLSFSKSAVSQIFDRSSGVLGAFADQVEVTTFHAFAWKLIARWGNGVGITGPTLFSPSEKKIFGASGALEFDDLIPAAARILQIPAVGNHLRRRWSVIVVDEFQDTSDEHWQLIMSLRGEARLVLLGDLNQCIYKNLPNNPGVGPGRVATALALRGARQILLPAVSHRDPTYTLPAAADAIRRRQFHEPALAAALERGMLEVRNEPDIAREAEAVVKAVEELRAEGHTVGIFSHHVDSTAALSDQLHSAGVAHDIVGLPDAVDAALRAQFALLSFACGEGEPSEVSRALAIFVASSERGRTVPVLARMIARQMPRTATLERRLRQLSNDLSSCRSLAAAVEIAVAAFDSVGLSRGQGAWNTASALLKNMIGPRALTLSDMPVKGLGHLKASLEGHHLSLLTQTHEATCPPVQIMGLYQTKGREVDASIVILREGDYFGGESEPMPDNSKLLYVVLTRARKKTLVLTVGNDLPPLVAPFERLYASGSVAGTVTPASVLSPSGSVRAR